MCRSPGSSRTSRPPGGSRRSRSPGCACRPGGGASTDARVAHCEFRRLGPCRPDPCHQGRPGGGHDVASHAWDGDTDGADGDCDPSDRSSDDYGDRGDGDANRCPDAFQVDLKSMRIELKGEQ